MVAVSVNIDTAKLAEVQAALRDIKNGASKALAGAINDTTKKARTKISTEVRQKVNIKKKDVDPHINNKPPATPSRPTGRITVQATARIGLAKFGARQNAKGLSYAIEKGGARKTIPGGFGSPKGKGNFRWVGVRVGKERFPLIYPKGVSAYGVFLKAGIMDRTINISEQDLYAALDRRVKFMVGVANGTIAQKGRIHGAVFK